MTDCTVVALHASDPGVRVHLHEGGTIDVDHIVLLLGYQPNTDEPWLSELALVKDAAGWKITGYAGGDN